MKKITLIILAVLLIVVIAGYLVVRGIEKNLESLADLPLPDLDLTLIEDGTYTGSYSAFPVSAEVAVTVNNHAITGIELLNHSHGRGEAAEAIPGKIVEAQTLLVDVVTGATYSSMVILQAIADALTGSSNP